MPELFRGGNGPDGDKHHLALADLNAPAPLDEQTAAAVVPASDVGPDEGGGLRAAQTAASSSSLGGPDGEIAVRTTDLLTAVRKPRGGSFCLTAHNGHWRKTPLSRHWRKYRRLSLASGWRKRYRWFRWPVAYPKAWTIAGLRYR